MIACARVESKLELHRTEIPINVRKIARHCNVPCKKMLMLTRPGRRKREPPRSVGEHLVFEMIPGNRRSPKKPLEIVIAARKSPCQKCRMAQRQHPTENEKKRGAPCSQLVDQLRAALAAAKGLVCVCVSLFF